MESVACHRQRGARSRMPNISLSADMPSVKRTVTGLLTISLLFAVSATSSSAMVFAQEQPDAIEGTQVEETHASDVEKKVIHEPVHRVPKVATNIAPLTSAVSGIVPKVINNVPPKATNKVPSMLPSAAIPVTEPAKTEPAPTTEPAATTEPARNLIPAIPASATKKVAPHPLDDALETAHRGLINIRENVRDYSAIMVKRERVDGKLLKPEYMQIKVRSEGVDERGARIPFSVYMKFIKPKASAGREVIWVKGKNQNRLCVHEGSGLISLKRLNLEPEGWIAMQGQRYPIYEAGMENLVVKLIEKAERDKAAGDCEVIYSDGVKINGRACSVIEVIHAEQRAPYDFHIAKVYIDDELRLPIRYQAHLWPENGSTKPRLLEEYTYLHVKVNQGFTDEDFNPDNPAYSYPKR